MTREHTNYKQKCVLKTDYFCNGTNKRQHGLNQGDGQYPSKHTMSFQTTFYKRQNMCLLGRDDEPSASQYFNFLI